MTGITDEQANAAASHIKLLLTRQFEASRNHPDDKAARIDPQTARGFAGTLYLRFTAELAKPGLRFCHHALRRLAQPLFYRVWKPGRVMCERCMPSGQISAPVGHPCEACGGSTPGSRLYMQTYQLAFVALYFGLCQGCTDMSSSATAAPMSNSGFSPASRLPCLVATPVTRAIKIRSFG